jgi:hypothetical protein
LLVILNSLVFSKLFYCSTVWSATTKQNIQKLQLVQNFAACVLTNTNKFDHISPILQQLGWSSIEKQLLLRHATQMYKIINAFAPLYLSTRLRKRQEVHRYNTRHKDHLNAPTCRTATARRSFCYHGVTIWNLFSSKTRNSQMLIYFKLNTNYVVFKLYILTA